MLRLLRLPAAGAALLVLGGCGSAGFSGIYGLPLPGGADLGSHPYTVRAEFADVLDLVPQAAVKVNNVAVGRVTKIELPGAGWTARVTMQVNGSVRLPANATAQLRQSSLLGEKYVQLAEPGRAAPAAVDTLADGATIPLSRTNRNPEVEEVLGAFSLLLNGGGIAQVHTISVELSDALDGNEPQLHELLGRLDTLVSSLDVERTRITDALDGLNRLSATLAARDDQIGAVLDDLTPGLKVLDEQRESFVAMLQALDRLSDVAVGTIEASQADFVADLKALQPILRQLANAGQALPQALEVLLTYPFTDAVLDGIKGDYLNIYLSVVAQPGTTVIAPLVPGAQVPRVAPQSPTGPRPGAPPPLPLPGVAGPGAAAPGSGFPSASGPPVAGPPSSSPSSPASDGPAPPASDSPAPPASDGPPSSTSDGPPSPDETPSGSTSDVPSSPEGGG
jgi:phospholipid/cholesterol/gamma-HCH transport system substrate-binding protein